MSKLEQILSLFLGLLYIPLISVFALQFSLFSGFNPNGVNDGAAQIAGLYALISLILVIWNIVKPNRYRIYIIVGCYAFAIVLFLIFRNFVHG